MEDCIEFIVRKWIDQAPCLSQSVVSLAMMGLSRSITHNNAEVAPILQFSRDIKRSIGPKVALRRLRHLKHVLYAGILFETRIARGG